MGKSTNFKKWFTFVVLVISGGTIFKLSSLKDAFYIPMQEFMGLSHTQIGAAISLFSSMFLVSLIVYVWFTFSLFLEFKIAPP